jgi:TP901 family phage tail tape measure protein
MAMNLDAVLKISAQVIGQDGVDRLRSSIGGLAWVAESAKKGFGDMVKSASFQALAAGAAGLGVALGTSVREAVKFESAMADVKKVVPGLESAEGLRDMKGAILDLSRELPITAEGLAEIVAAAGQAGIEKDGLIDFARAAAQMAVAFDMTAGEAGDAMAKLRTSMGLSQEEVVSLADAMNYLSNNQASAAGEITDFMLRVGAFGQQVAMTEEQTAALGSAMIAAGSAPDVAATSFRNLIKEMAAGQNATAKQESAWGQLGLSATEVAKRMQTDAVPTIRDVFQRIAALPKELQIPIAEALFGNEARALAPLLSNMALFDQSMALVGDKTKYAGSMLAEFAARSGTSANSWQLLMNNVKALQIAIGDALIPALNLLLGILTPVISLIARGAQQFPWLTTAIVALTGAFVGLVAIMPLIASFLYALAQLSAMGVTFGGIAAIIGGLGATIAGFLGAVAPTLAAIMAVLGGAFAAIGGALTTLGTILVGVFSGPLGWIVLLAAAAAALFAFREPIMQFFAWVGQAFTAWIASLALWAAPFTTWWGNLWAQVQLLTGTFFTVLGQLLYQWFVQPWITIGQLIVSSTMAIWENVKGPVIGFFQWWQQFLYQWFIEPWVVAGARIADLAVQMWDGVKAGAAAAGQWIASTVQALFVDPFISARDFVVAAWGQLGTMIMGAWTNITSAFDQYVTQPIQAAWGALQTWMASAAQGIASSLQQAYSAIAGGIVGAFRGIVGTVGRVINGIIGMINNLIGGINRVRTAVGLSALSKIPLVDLPAFAQGGVVNRPTVALVGEGGEPEYIIPESKMAGAAMNYLDGARNQAVLMSRAPRPVSFGAGGGTTGGGGGGVSVNITTGPVLDQGGQKYVTLQDLEAAVRQTSTQIYATLRTPSGRRSMGMA